MKPFSIFIEDLQSDKEEFNQTADYDMGISSINPRITNLEVAHGMALTTVSFEFECFMDAISLLLNKKEDNSGIIQSCINNEFLIDLDSSDFNDRQLSNILRPAITDDNIRVSSLTIKDRFRLMDEFNTVNEILHALQLTPRNVIPDTQLFINTDKQTLHYHIIKERIKQVYNTSKVMSSNKKIDTNIKIAHPDYWFIEPDSSLKNYPTTHIPVEIVSPWIPAKDAITFVTNFRNDIAKKFNVITHKKTSMHCSFRTHIRDKDKKFPLKLNVLKLLALLDEDEHLDRFGRKDNEYTQPIQTKAFSSIINTNDLDDLKQQLEDVLSQNDKYNAINFEDFLTDYNLTTGNGRMEIRIIGDDYMGTLFHTAMRSLNHFIQLISAALDNDLYDKEYKNNLNKKMKGSVNSVEKIIKECEEICNSYIQEDDFVRVLTLSKPTLTMLLQTLNGLTNFSVIPNHNIEQLLIQTFAKLSTYIDVITFIRDWMDNHTVSNKLSDFIFDIVHINRPYDKIGSAINHTDKKLYTYFSILTDWVKDLFINVQDLNAVIKIILMVPNQLMIDKAKEVIDYMDFSTQSIFWKDILFNRKLNRSDDNEKVFNQLFANYLKD